MSSETKQRLQRSLSKRKRQTAPLFNCFNRWVALAQGNSILFKNREILQKLQQEYEKGVLTGNEIKKEANKMVELNVKRMSLISNTLKTRINGREVFNLPACSAQMWLKGKAGTSSKYPDSSTLEEYTFYIACREKQAQGSFGIVDVYFRHNFQSNAVYQYQFGMDTRQSALLFSSKLYHALLSGNIAGDQPVKGAFAILCINLAHTPNEQVKLRVIEGTIHPGQQRLRTMFVPKAQALLRGYLTRRRWQTFLAATKSKESMIAAVTEIMVTTRETKETNVLVEDHVSFLLNHYVIGVATLSSSSTGTNKNTTTMHTSSTSFSASLFPKTSPSSSLTTTSKNNREKKKRKRLRQRKKKLIAVLAIQNRSRIFLSKKKLKEKKWIQYQLIPLQRFVLRWLKKRRKLLATVVQLQCCWRQHSARICIVAKQRLHSSHQQYIRTITNRCFQCWSNKSKTSTKYRLQQRNIGNDLLKLVDSIDSTMLKLRPYHLSVISQIKTIISNSIPYAVTKLYGSWPLELSIPSSDIDIVVDWHAGRMKGNQTGIWRAGLPICIRGVGMHGGMNTSKYSQRSTMNTTSSTTTGTTNNMTYNTNLYQQQQQQFSNELEKTPLEIVSSELLNTHWVRNLKFIHSSRIPVIKLKAIATKTTISTSGTSITTPNSTGSDPPIVVDVDISGTTSAHVGLRAKTYLKKQLKQYPRLRLVALFVKQLLFEHGVSDAYNGGLRSFAVMLLLIRYYQHTYGPGLYENETEKSEKESSEKERNGVRDTAAINQKAKEMIEETFPTSSRTYVKVEISPKREKRKKMSSTFNNTSGSKSSVTRSRVNKKSKSKSEIGNGNGSVDVDLLAFDLLSFLEMFGKFDFSEVGISVAGNGQFFSLREAKMHNTYICCVMWGENVNVADNASRIFSIQQLFRSTRKKLLKQGVGMKEMINGLKF